MSKVINAIESRVSTRYYDTTKIISEEDYRSIIEAGRIAASGLATEPWKFINIKGDRNLIAAGVNHQPAAIDASNLLVIAYVKEGYVIKHPEFMDKFKTAFDKETYQRYEQILVNAVKTGYYKEQCMFAACSMVIQANAIGVDSLIMGGFDEKILLETLKLDSNDYGIALVLAFGYRNQEIKKKDKRSYEEVYLDITL